MHGSAISELTPARDIRLRLVRRKSCNRQSFTPQAMSNLSLKVENPEIGVRPSVVNTYSQSLMRGISASTFTAAFDSGSVTSTPVLYVSLGLVHSAPEISGQDIALASVRRQAASNKKRMNCPHGDAKTSAVLHTARNSSSVKIRSRSRCSGLRRAMPRTNGVLN